MVVDSWTVSRFNTGCCFYELASNLGDPNMAIEPSYCDACACPLTRREHIYNMDRYILVCANTACPKCDPIFHIQELSNRVNDLKTWVVDLRKEIEGLKDEMSDVRSHKS